MLRKDKPRLPVQQLLILSICRFAEPVVMTSILPYLPEMIESVGVPKDEVAKWVGIASAVVAGCQCIMGVPWGRLSDRIGRKPVILLGLTFTMVFSLVFGFSHSLTQLILARAFLGFMNGNVGIIRTMVAEMVPEKELQPRAFSIMPLVWTIGSIFGPAFGGALANPAKKHPRIFGGCEFLKKYPFALPNLAAAVLFVIGITTGFLFLHETLESKKDSPDYGVILGQILTSPCTSRRRKSIHFTTRNNETTALLAGDGCRESELDPEANSPRKSTSRERKKQPTETPSWRQVLTVQSSLVLLAYGMMAMHAIAFDSLLPVFLHNPEQQLEDNPDVRLPFKFAGGFGIDSQAIGMFYTLIGIVGMFIQFFVFPAAAKRYGALNCLKVTSILLPLLYFVTPFIVLVPKSLRYPTVFALMMTKLSATIFTFPCSIILLTNSATSLNVLGTLNGIGTSVSAIGRAAGPAIVGAMFTYGIEKGYVIVPWWALTALAALSAVPVFWIVEQDGFQANGHDRDESEEDGDPSKGERGTGGVYGSTAAGTCKLNGRVDGHGSEAAAGSQRQQN